ncbi:MAG: hypothetical protein HFK09_07700 [Clostridia bacterium]|nr:hypothetical protein [Clostridia bacterium]
MPYIKIESGKLPEEQKTALIEKITEIAAEITSIPQEFFITTITELPDANFGIGGKTIDKYKSNDLNVSFERAANSDIYSVFILSKTYIDKFENIRNGDYCKVLDRAFQKAQKSIDDYNRIIVNGCKAGYYCFHKNENFAELDEVFVTPPFHISDVCKSIVENCLDKTALPIVTRVYTKDLVSIEIFKRLGFEISGNIENSKFLMKFKNR